jgi:hypothetical protein
MAIDRKLHNPRGMIQISKHEQYINQWKRINPVFHPNHHSSLHTIGVPHLDHHNEPTDDPDAAASWSTITDPLLIEERLLARNITHFGQTEGTLFTTKRLQELFGYSRVNEATEHLLNGNSTIPSELELSPGGHTLLNLLSKNSQLPTLLQNIQIGIVQMV